MQQFKQWGKHLILLLLVGGSIQAQTVTGVYVYPVKPGTPEWRSLKSHVEMRNVCQIPDAILIKMDSEALIESCLDYPLYGDMFTFDSQQAGFEWVVAGFNGLGVLLERRDAATLLCDKYVKMNPDGFHESATLLEKAKIGARLSSIEILLSQTRLLSGLDKDRRLVLLRTCLNMADAKTKNPNVYGIASMGTLGLLAGRLLVSEDETFKSALRNDDSLSEFLRVGNIPSPPQVAKILEHTALYIARH